MSKYFLLEIVTPERKFFENEVEMAVVRTTEGDIGILKNHEPLVAPLKIGGIKIILGDKKRYAALSTGFVSITEEKVTIITDTAEWSSEIDIERAKADFEQAKQRIHENREAEDITRARIALAKALNRMRVADKTFDHTDF